MYDRRLSVAIVRYVHGRIDVSDDKEHEYVYQSVDERKKQQACKIRE